MLKKNILFIIINFLFLAVGNAQIIDDNNSSKSQVIDEIVAQVGDLPIFHSDIETQKLQILSEGGAINEQTTCSILEEYLYQRLLLRQAKYDSIEVTDEQVNAEMENRLRMIENQIGSRENLEKFYGKTYQQIKDEFREDIRDRMLAQEMERQITEDVEISPKEVKSFYNSIPKDSIPFINENISIQQIVIYPKINQNSVNEVINKLNRWREQVINEESSFSTLATIHSEDLGSAKDGGKIEASRGMMVKPFEAAAFSLQPGEISHVVKTEYGYHLVQLVSRKGDDYVVRHILLTPEVGRKELAEAATLLDECHAKLNKNEITWNEAVREYSEDQESKQNQGTIINPYTGELYWDVAHINQIDPQIFDIINGLKEGQISSPSLFTEMRSRKEAIRIVRISDRTQPHRANIKDDYNFLKEAAINQKKQEIISNWINDRVKKTYIRIHDNYVNCSFLYNWVEQ